MHRGQPITYDKFINYSMLDTFQVGGPVPLEDGAQT
jgi:hypothetical protein